MDATVSKAEYDRVVAEKNEQIATLKFRYEKLVRQIFDASSEQRPTTGSLSDAAQINLFGAVAGAGLGDEQPNKVPASDRPRKPRKKHPGRAPLPAHLSRREVTIEPDVDTTGMVRIGEDVTEKVEYTPASLVVVRYVRPRYAWPRDERPAGADENAPAVIVAPAPDQVLPKAIAGVGLLVSILIGKYIDHLPLYRQRAQWRRDYDWEVPASTVGDWVGAVYRLLEPLYQALQTDVLDTDYLQGDESRIRVLRKTVEEDAARKTEKQQAGGKSGLGYMWVFRNPITGNVLFAYRRSRGTQVLDDILGNYTGVLQSDGYSAYTKYKKNHPDMQLVSCLAHIRRKFFEARGNDPRTAELALMVIAVLYRAERRCGELGYTTEQRQVLRRRFSARYFEAFLGWVEREYPNRLPKSAIGLAFKYALNHLPRLRPYLNDGRIEIDNNQIENKIRPLAVGRKNYLFAGSKAGADRAAMLYSFFASCRALEINEREWLGDVLLRIGDHPVNRIAELLPGAWAKAHAAGVTE